MWMISVLVPALLLGQAEWLEKASGDRLRHHREWGASLQHYRKALEVRRDFPEVHVAMGDVYVHTKDYVEAFESYTNAIHYLRARIEGSHGKPDPHDQVAGWAEDIRGVFRRCDTLLEERRFDEAHRARIGQLFVSLTNLPAFQHDGTMYYLLGNYLYETERQEEAYRVLRRGLELGSSSQALIYRLIGVIRWDQYQSGKMPEDKVDEYLEEAYHNLKRAVFLAPETGTSAKIETLIRKVEAERKRRAGK